jgi:hypothetical protein
MGCGASSTAQADEAPFRPVSPRAHAAAARELGRDARGTMHFGPAAVAAAPPPPPPPPPPSADEERGEKVSAVTLERLRSTFLSTASRGSVYDNYTLLHTLGARPLSLLFVPCCGPSLSYEPGASACAWRSCRGARRRA